MAVQGPDVGRCEAERLPPSLAQVVAAINDRPRDALRVADLAAMVGTTPRALQKSFRRHLGCTPMEYLRRVRLQGAHDELLSTGPDSGRGVIDVALSWGFAHPGRFAARHLDTFGTSPGELLRRDPTRDRAPVESVTEDGSGTR